MLLQPGLAGRHAAVEVVVKLEPKVVEVVVVVIPVVVVVELVAVAMVEGMVVHHELGDRGDAAREPQRQYGDKGDAAAKDDVGGGARVGVVRARGGARALYDGVDDLRGLVDLFAHGSPFVSVNHSKRAGRAGAAD